MELHTLYPKSLRRGESFGAFMGFRIIHPIRIAMKIPERNEL
jgi:hypothetical protein